MTRAVRFTQASLRRTIAAARKEGLRIVGIRPDGTVITKDGDNPEPNVAAIETDYDTASISKWRDVQA
jgi:hypothetical protein